MIAFARLTSGINRSTGCAGVTQPRRGPPVHQMQLRRGGAVGQVLQATCRDISSLPQPEFWTVPALANVAQTVWFATLAATGLARLRPSRRDI